MVSGNPQSRCDELPAAGNGDVLATSSLSTPCEQLQYNTVVIMDNGTAMTGSLVIMELPCSCFECFHQDYPAEKAFSLDSPD